MKSRSARGNRRPTAELYEKQVSEVVVIKLAALSAALLAAALFGRVHAQAAVEDPGYCAQYYPNANCQNYGPGNPLYRGAYGEYFAPARPDGYAATVPIRRHHRRHHHG